MIFKILKTERPISNASFIPRRHICGVHICWTGYLHVCIYGNKLIWLDLTWLDLIWQLLAENHRCDPCILLTYLWYLLEKFYSDWDFVIVISQISKVLHPSFALILYLYTKTSDISPTIEGNKIGNECMQNFAIFLVILPSDECHWTLLMISQNRFG